MEFAVSVSRSIFRNYESGDEVQMEHLKKEVVR